MNISEITESLKASKNASDQALRLIKNLVLLDQDRLQNFKKLQSQAERLTKLFNEHRQDQSLFDAGYKWCLDFASKLCQSEDKLKTQFINDFADELTKHGFVLSGNLPLLRAGIFRIEFNPRSWSLKYWYGPRQELLTVSPLSASINAETLKQLKVNLGSQLNPQAFIDLTSRTYKAKTLGRHGDLVPINTILENLSTVLSEGPGPNGKAQPKKYGRADFSFDLFRIRGVSGAPLLTIATKAFTKNRNSFLWIPSSENGDGSSYSHLRFMEE